MGEAGGGRVREVSKEDTAAVLERRKNNTES